MIIETSILANFLKDPVIKLTGWSIDKTLKGFNSQKLKKSLSSLSENITEVVKVKTIYKGDSSIDLHEFYVPTRIKNVSRNINSIADIDQNSIVLEGTVGQGKSIFMRYLTYKEALIGKRVPIFFELRKLEPEQTLLAAISLTISEWIPLFTDSDFERLAESGKLVLFLDGFDEISHGKIQKILNEIESWHKKYHKMQLIISSRPNSEIQRLNNVKVYYLAPYTFPEQEKLISKLVSESETRESLRKSILESTSEIKSLLTTPLMVTLYVMIYRARAEPPKTQSEFYKNIFSILSTRHDKTKPGYKREFNSGLGETRLQKIFEEFCFISSKREKLVLSYPEAIEIIDACIKNKNIKVEPSDVLQDLSKVVCLLPMDGLNYTFIHKSIQEYFYASFLMNKSETFKSGFYKQYSKSHSLYSRAQVVVDFLKDVDRYSYVRFYQLPFIKEYINAFEINVYSNKILDNLLIREEQDNHKSIKLLIDEGIISCHFVIPDFAVNIFKNIAPFLNHANEISYSFGLHDSPRKGLIDMGYIYMKDYILEDEYKELSEFILEETNKLLRLCKDLESYVAMEEDYEY